MLLRMLNFFQRPFSSSSYSFCHSKNIYKIWMSLKWQNKDKKKCKKNNNIKKNKMKKKMIHKHTEIEYKKDMAGYNIIRISIQTIFMKSDMQERYTNL